MTEQEYNKIESLLIALDSITKHKKTKQKVKEALAILDRHKQLLIHSVSKSFYCEDVVEYNSERCDKQCNNCYKDYKNYKKQQ